MKILHHYTHDHNLESAEILVPEILKFYSPKSVIDVGCGIGCWLSVFKKHGVQDILGIDGKHVPEKLLKIQRSQFLTADLSSPQKIKIPYKFDLVCCLEVAEHLPSAAAEDFIIFLTSLGDKILFSAAIPEQTGENHLNEQYPSYWASLFNKHDFIFLDAFRERFWNNERIAWWYRQNLFLVVKTHSSLTSRFKPFNGNTYIHPQLFGLYSHKNINDQRNSLITKLKKFFSYHS